MQRAATAASHAVALSSRVLGRAAPRLATDWRHSLGLGKARLFSSSPEDHFKAAVMRAKDIKTDNNNMLKLYALFKQAENGKCNTSQPGFFDVKGRYKWDAWNRLGNMSKQEAMLTYTKLVDELAPVKDAGQREGNYSTPCTHEDQAAKPKTGGSALVSYKVDNKGVATVFLDSVTMPPQLFFDVGTTVREMGAHPSVRVIVIRGGPRKPHFSYGLDLKAAGGDLVGVKMDGPRHQLHKLIKDWQDGFNAIAESPKPVIAAVEGWCIGAGLDLISACDVRLASADAKISLREAALGIVADLGALNRLPSIIGDSSTRMMALTACDVKADRALTMGLVSEVYPTGADLYAAAQEMAETMASRDPNCLMGVKNVMNQARDKAVREGLDYVAAWNSAFLPMQDLASKVLGGGK